MVCSLSVYLFNLGWQKYLYLQSHCLTILSMNHTVPEFFLIWNPQIRQPSQKRQKYAQHNRPTSILAASVNVVLLNAFKYMFIMRRKQPASPRINIKERYFPCYEPTYSDKRSCWRCTYYRIKENKTINIANNCTNKRFDRRYSRV